MKIFCELQFIYLSVNRLSIAKLQDFIVEICLILFISSNVGEKMRRNHLNYTTLIMFIFFLIIMSIQSINSTKVLRPKKDSFYYISTDEGLLSHYRQLEIIWNMANAVNRYLRIVPFHSKHYPGLDNIQMCDIFVLPSNITCDTKNQTQVFNTKNCIFTGLLFPSIRYGFPADLPVSKDFQYSNVSCVSGFINMNIGRTPPFTRHTMLRMPIFQEKYLKLLPIIRNILKVVTNNTEYMLVHWRRGDQLEFRCAGNKNDPDKQNNTLKLISKDNSRRKLVDKGRFDHSVNCASAKDFYNEVKIVAKQQFQLEKPILTYIATNEQNSDSLSYLKNKKYKLFNDIKEGLIKELNLNLTVLDEFVIELMLMCDATYYIAWGESSIHHFVNKCRFFDTTKKHLTFIDDYHVTSLNHTKSTNHTLRY